MAIGKAKTKKRGKVRGSPKSSGHHECLYKIHPIVVVIPQSGPKWRTNQETDVAIPGATPIA